MTSVWTEIGNLLVRAQIYTESDSDLDSLYYPTEEHKYILIQIQIQIHSIIPSREISLAWCTDNETIETAVDDTFTHTEGENPRQQ